MKDSKDEIEGKLNTTYILIFFLGIYLLVGAAVSSYIGEKQNKQISVREYISITINLPVLAFAKIRQEFDKSFEDTTPLLDRCAVECHRRLL